MRTHTVSTASCRVQPARSGAFRVSASTSHSAVPARWAVIRAARAASSASVEDPSKTASTRPADRTWAGPITPATIERSSSTPSAARAAAAQLRSSTGTGSASPAIATSIAALSTRALVPNSDSTVG
jgi:hypothetical protein